ncbi:uncharacterized protein F4807DRAFT_389410 [Annulohypoxylon truncatum]|uniref:uncharacterized protein n=1 Tax=Annulohypoxylon truncatum TaxID=327061 RepID=UPI002007F0DD|nr:uncharacterized protein F4807DRAFT_389410 [Annulohypoxylon truncatum]KAI1204072.1 hypothetical protein F4807DRAFT_389410 [Annulohypoxylon truncatum]
MVVWLTIAQSVLSAFISGLYRDVSSTMLSGAITHPFILVKDLNIIQDQVNPGQKNGPLKTSTRKILCSTYPVDIDIPSHYADPRFDPSLSQVTGRLPGRLSVHFNLQRFCPSHRRFSPSMALCPFSRL